MNLVVSGPGGAGKGTVVRRACESDDRLWLSTSWTTRARRPGEAESAYTFVDKVQFLDHVAKGGFLEWTSVLGEFYGTPKPAPPPGHDAVFEIDVQGAENVRATCEQVVCVLLLPPSVEVQRERLLKRGDPEEHVRRRVELGEAEVERARHFVDGIVVNDDLDQAVGELLAIVEAARTRFSTG